MPELRSGDHSSRLAPAADKNSFIVPTTTNGYGDHENGEAEAFIKTLDEKRKELDQQISLYIAEKQKEYEIYERQLRENFRRSKDARHTDDSSKVSKEETDDQSTEGASRSTLQPAQSASRLPDFPPLKLEDDSITEKENASDTLPKDGLTKRNPSRDPEELMGLFTPTFLPLLEGKKLGSKGHNRSSSAPPDSLKRAAEEPTIPVAQRVEVRRSSTEPAFQAKHIRKSSLRQSSAMRSPHQQTGKPRKHVTLDIGDAIVDPAMDPTESEPEPTTPSPTHHSLKPAHTEDLPPSAQSPTQTHQPIIQTQQSATQAQEPSTKPASGSTVHNDAMFFADPAAPTSPPRPLDSPTSSRSGSIPPLEPFSRPSPSSSQATAGASAPRGAEITHFFAPPDDDTDTETAESGYVRRASDPDGVPGSFVGGIDGDSGFDPADMGSFGYPGTSLGASYMEAHHSWRQSMTKQQEEQRRDKGKDREVMKGPESPQNKRSDYFDVLMHGQNDVEDEFVGEMEDL